MDELSCLNIDWQFYLNQVWWNGIWLLSFAIVFTPFDLFLIYINVMFREFVLKNLISVIPLFVGILLCIHLGIQGFERIKHPENYVVDYVTQELENIKCEGVSSEIL